MSESKKLNKQSLSQTMQIVVTVAELNKNSKAREEAAKADQRKPGVVPPRAFVL